jgi:hypothetical protein
VDIGLAVDPANNRDMGREGKPLPAVTVKEVGDLNTYGALGTIDARGKILSSSFLAIERVIAMKDLLRQLQIDEP